MHFKMHKIIFFLQKKKKIKKICVPTPPRHLEHTYFFFINFGLISKPNLAYNFIKAVLLLMTVFILFICLR